MTYALDERRPPEALDQAQAEHPPEDHPHEDDHCPDCGATALEPCKRPTNCADPASHPPETPTAALARQTKRHTFKSSKNAFEWVDPWAELMFLNSTRDALKMERQAWETADGERKILQAHVAELQALVERSNATSEKALAGLAEFQTSFDLRRGADQRARKAWQVATGRDLTWPDHADLVVFLLERLFTAGTALVVAKDEIEWSLINASPLHRRQASLATVTDALAAVQGLVGAPVEEPT